MIKKLSISAAALVAVGFAGAASAASDTGNVEINVIVEEIIELTIHDPIQEYTVTELGSNPNDYAGSLDEADKARFTVTSNAPWEFDVSFPTWVATTAQGGNGSYNQAAFESASNTLIGGSLHVDFDLGSSVGNEGLCRQTSGGVLNNSANCGSGTATMTGGQDLWLGAAVNPEITDDPSGIAPVDTYSLTATITVSTL